MIGISFPSLGGSDNSVVGFDSSNPSVLQFSHPITGAAVNETIRGLDYWNGTVYALGSGGNLYSLDYSTGQLTLIGGLGVVLNGAAFGVENDLTGFDIVSELGQNLSANRTTGAASVRPAVNPAGTFLSALAFRDSTNTMFGIDSSQNSVGVFNPITGSFTTIGLLGFDVARNNGFDIAPGGAQAFLASGATSSDVQANLYMVNLATGQATLVGLIGQPGDNNLLRGLTMVPATPAPEPASMTLLGLGLAGLGARRWLQRKTS